MLHLEECLGHRLCITKAADAEVPQEWFGSDERQRRFLEQVVLLELIAHVEDKLIRRAEAGRALRRADHDWSRVLQEAFPGVAGLLRMRDVADRPGVLLRPQARHTGKVDLRASGDQQVVVGYRLTVGEHQALLQVEPGHTGLDKVNMMLGVDWADIKCDIVFIAQAERIPDQRRDEDEVVGIGHDGDVVIVAEQLVQLQRAGVAGEAGADHDNAFTCHVCSSDGSARQHCWPGRARERIRYPPPVSPYSYYTRMRRGAQERNSRDW